MTALWKSPFQVSSAADGQESDPAIADLSDGKIAFAWTVGEVGPVGDYARGINTRLLDLFGEPVIAPRTVVASSYTEGYSQPQVLALSGGGYVVPHEYLFVSGTIGGGNYDTRVAIMSDVDGARTDLQIINGGPFLFSPYPAPNAATALTGTGLTLSLYRNDLAGLEARTHDLATDVSGAVVPVMGAIPIGTGVGNVVQSDLVTRSDGKVAGTILIDYGDATADTVHSVTFNANGSLARLTALSDVGGEVTGVVAMAALGAGTSVAVWTVLDAGQARLRYQMIDAAGDPDGILRSVAIAGAQSQPEVAPLSDGGFLLLWSDGTRDCLVAQRIAADGVTLVGAALDITVPLTGPALDIEADLLGDGRVAVTWRTLSGPRGPEVMSAIVDPRDVAGVTRNGANVIGLAGDDMIVGPAAPTVYGWTGNDEIASAPGSLSPLELHGQSGNDTLTGGGGWDRLFGGDGNDTLTGGTGNDWLSGGDGDDVLDAGNEVLDRLDGGAGVDTLLIATTGTISFNMSTGYYSRSIETYSNIENATITNNARLWLTGSDAANTVVSGIQEDRLDGAAGNDTLMAGGGNDTLWGRNGDDELFGEGGNDLLYAGNGADRIHGGAGNDHLDGGAGADVMAGGLGKDRYIVDMATDTIVDEIGYSAGGGIDTVEAWVDWTLGANLEILRLQGTGDLNGTGNDAPETLVGTAGRNDLRGRGGADMINGKAGDDTITGGGAADRLTGDVGADTFVYVSISDSYAGAATRDLLNGFVHGHDRIDLSAIDANPYLPGDQAFDFGGIGALTGAGTASAGELRFQRYGGDWNILSADWNGDGVAEMQIFVNGTNFMTGTDFLL